MKKYQKQMVIGDDHTGYQKTSLQLTRSITEDIALKVRKVKNEIDNNNIDFNYSEWQEFISYCWNDDIWIMSMNKAIEMCKEEKLNLNKNREFLKIISEKSPSELKNSFKKSHIIARFSLMDTIYKKPPEKEEPRKAKDLWP